MPMKISIRFFDPEKFCDFSFKEVDGRDSTEVLCHRFSICLVSVPQICEAHSKNKNLRKRFAS